MHAAAEKATRDAAEAAAVLTRQIEEYKADTGAGEKPQNRSSSEIVQEIVQEIAPEIASGPRPHRRPTFHRRLTPHRREDVKPPKKARRKRGSKKQKGAAILVEMIFSENRYPLFGIML